MFKLSKFQKIAGLILFAALVLGFLNLSVLLVIITFGVIYGFFQFKKSGSIFGNDDNAASGGVTKNHNTANESNHRQENGGHTDARAKNKIDNNARMRDLDIEAGYVDSAKQLFRYRIKDKLLLEFDFSKKIVRWKVGNIKNTAIAKKISEAGDSNRLDALELCRTSVVYQGHDPRIKNPNFKVYGNLFVEFLDDIEDGKVIEFPLVSSWSVVGETPEPFENIDKWEEIKKEALENTWKKLLQFRICKTAEQSFIFNTVTDVIKNWKVKGKMSLPHYKCSCVDLSADETAAIQLWQLENFEEWRDLLAKIDNAAREYCDLAYKAELQLNKVREQSSFSSDRTASDSQ